MWYPKNDHGCLIIYEAEVKNKQYIWNILFKIFFDDFQHFADLCSKTFILIAGFKEALRD